MVIPHCFFPKVFPTAINNPYDKRTCVWLRLLPICWKYCMLGIYDVQDVGCEGRGMFGKWDVPDVGCSGCGIFGGWDVQDVGCSRCEMFGRWDVRDVGWLPGCGMLTSKMPIKVPPLKLGAYLILEVHNTLFKGPT